MDTFNAKRISAKKQTADLENKVAQLEGNFQGLVGEMNPRFSTLFEMIDVLATVVGVDAVNLALQEKRAVDTERNIARAVAEGRLTDASPDATVGPGTLIQLSETTPEGEVKSPGRFYLAFSSLSDESRADLGGLAAGGSFLAKNGSTVKVLKIYSEVTGTTPAPAQEPSVVVAPDSTVEA